MKSIYLYLTRSSTVAHSIVGYRLGLSKPKISIDALALSTYMYVFTYSTRSVRTAQSASVNIRHLNEAAHASQGSVPQIPSLLITYRLAPKIVNFVHRPGVELPRPGKVIHNRKSDDRSDHEGAEVHLCGLRMVNGGPVAEEEDDDHPDASEYVVDGAERLGNTPWAPSEMVRVDGVGALLRDF